MTRALPKGPVAKGWLRAMAHMPMSERSEVRYPSLVIEAALLTLLAVVIPIWVGMEQVGFFSLFLLASSLFTRFDSLLVENRENIFSRGVSSLDANARTAMSITGMFIGICVAYFISALWLTEVGVTAFFSFAVDASDLRRGSWLGRDFGAAWPIFVHNLGVAASVLLLCLIYRAYGALLALGWNAAVWVCVLTTLAMRGFDESTAHPVMYVLTSCLAVLPHLLLEAIGYILAALAGIYVSKGLMTYSLQDDVLYNVLGAAAWLTGAAFAVIGAAALAEATLPPLLLAWL